MRDARLVSVAARQANRISRAQLELLGYSPDAIQHRLDRGRLSIVEQGVYGVAPVLDDDQGRLMTAVLTHPDSYLSHLSGVAAYGAWTLPRTFETITRPGSGGPRRHGGVLVFRSETLAGETTSLGPLSVTTPERTLLDLATSVSDRALARAFREIVRLGHTSSELVVDYLHARPGRRGRQRLLRTASAYAGLPLARARSGAEVRAMILLRDAGCEVPDLNRKVAGLEADLVWRRHRLIVEIDGGPFHLDVGEDARKADIWRAAGWRVERLPSDAVYDAPHLLLALAPERP